MPGGIRLICGLLVGALMLPAADFSGYWFGHSVSGRRNQVTDFAFKIVQTGAEVSGKVYLDYGSTPIIRGSVEGEQITFFAIQREQDGNQINESLIKFVGVFNEDGSLELTRERQELRNAGNAGASFSRPGKQTITLKRLP